MTAPGQRDAAGVSVVSLADPTRESGALRVVRLILRRMFCLVFRLRVTGLEHLPSSGPVLVVGNHAGFLDGPLVFMVLPRPSMFLVKSELFAGPFRTLLRWAHQIPVIRGTPDRTALHRGVAVLAGGGVLGMFPEGTRGSGAMESIQHGVGYLALHSPAPVVPVVCRGTADALPKGSTLPKWRSPVDIVFGPPLRIEVAGDTRARATVADAAEQIRTGLAAHLAATEQAAVGGARDAA